MRILHLTFIAACCIIAFTDLACARRKTVKKRQSSAQMEQARIVSNGDAKKHCEAIVVGSGYGSAVAALRLGEAGVQTTILEMGLKWDPPRHGQPKSFCNMNTADKRAVWFSKTIAPPISYMWIPTKWVLTWGPPYPGVLDRVYNLKKDNSVFVGRGFGGGSLVNGGMSPTPNQTYFEDVFRPYLGDKVGELSKTMYDKYFRMAKKQLRVNEIDPEWFNNTIWYNFARVSRGLAKNAKLNCKFIPNVYDFKYMHNEADFPEKYPRSALASEVIYGNNYGKQSLDKTYLKDALATGNVAVLELHRVHSITHKDDGTFELAVEKVSENGPTAKSGNFMIFTCDKLFLGAGSLGTSELLVRSRDSTTKLKLSDEVGKHWGNNGNVMVGLSVKQNTGTNQSSIPALAIDDWNNTVPVFAEIAPFPAPDLLQYDLALYLAITKVSQQGKFTYNPESDSVELNWTPAMNNNSVYAAKQLFDRIIDANKKEGVDYRTDLFDKKFADNFSYHPLGGCVLGNATDEFGRVKDTSGKVIPNLYVMDGSLIPGSLGVNPFLTITALAERNMATIIDMDIRKKEKKV